jgi:recombinational DNA repair protein RecT
MYPRGGKLVVDLDAHGKREALENMPTIEKIETAVVVYKDDKFSYDPKRKQVVLHEQAWPTPQASKETIKAVYCVVHYKNGTTQDIAMSVAEIEIARSHSQQPNGSTWTKNYAEMAKKTVYNRTFKELYKLPRTAVIYQQFEAPETQDIPHAEVTDQSASEASGEEFTPTETVDQESGEVVTPTSGQPEQQNDEESFLPK